MVSYIAQRLKFAKNQRDFKTWLALKYMLVCGCLVWEELNVIENVLTIHFFPILRKQIICKDKSLICHIQSLVGMLS